METLIIIIAFVLSILPYIGLYFIFKPEQKKNKKHENKLG